MSHRILIAGVWHETNTFSPVATDLAAFRAYQYAEGAAVIARYSDTNTEIGGAIAAAAELDFSLQPALFAGAVPSGMVTAAAFEAIAAETVGRIAAFGLLDGALVMLHGAMVADGIDQADAAYLQRIVAALPAGTPVVATFDNHANLSAELVAGAAVLIGYDTYPHTDMAARGAEAARVLHRILTEGRRPVAAFAKLPLLAVPQVQVTDDPPMAEVMAALAEVERRPGIWLGSVALGFPYADVAHLGMAVLVYGDDRPGAERAADDLARLIWSRRREFEPALVPVSVAVARAAAAANGPIILVDVADNVGGGAPGDGTLLLKALLASGTDSAAVVIWDPAAAAAARAVGQGGRLTTEVGGKTDGLHGKPARLTGTVAFLGPVTYRRLGSYMTGQTVALGEVAVIDCAGVQVMVTSARAMPFDTDHLRAVGIEPERTHLIVVKSAIAWRAHFQPFAAGAIYVDTPGICASNLERFAFTKLAGPVHPLHETGDSI